MAEQTTVTTQPAAWDESTVTPSAGGFAPQVSIHSVATLTLGRQTFNDSDKDNYFEG